MNFYQLIGDPAENFYQLGVKDRGNVSGIYHHVRSLLSTKNNMANNIIEGILSQLSHQVLKNNLKFKKNISAYAEGLNLPVAHVMTILLIPEIMSCSTKWAPSLPVFTLQGCSSFFTHDEDFESPIHGRILDSAFFNSFDKYERAILYHFNNGPKIFSYSTAGLPYPSLTAMNELGITISLHHKFSSDFYISGTPIFEIIFQILQLCQTKKDVLSYLQNVTSISSWGLYISFKDNDILRVDISGDKIDYNVDKVISKKIFYYNNLPENKNINLSNTLPYGMNQYCKLRSKSANKKIKKINKKKTINQLNLLKFMSIPEHGQDINSQSWALEPINHCSVGAYTLDAVNGRSLSVSGPAPKYFNGEYSEFTNIWENPLVKLRKTKTKITPSRYYLGMRSLALAQVAIDSKEIVNAYHNLQISMNQLEGYYELNIAKFYFAVLQYIHEPNTELRFRMLNKFRELEDNLPSYLNDHCLLFISRLEVILRGESFISPEQVQHKKLQNILQIEKKIPSSIMHKATAKFIMPRIEFLDIYYHHLK